jgi:nucleoside-diphosphate-sugar epimerase
VKVAIQGASGFVGSRLMETLHVNGLAEVIPIVRKYGSLPRIARFNLEWRLADALDEDALAKAFDGCEVVFHAVSGPDLTILESPDKTVRAARRAGVRRIVYLSTGVAYGFNPGQSTNDETKASVNQRWTYGRAKARAEARIAAARRLSDVDLVVLIPTIVYGPRSTHFTLEIAERLLHGTAFLVNDGKGICNSIYVDNLVQAMWLAATVQEARNQDFFVSDRELVTWADLYESVAGAIGVSMKGVRRITREEAIAAIDVVAPLQVRLRQKLRQGPGKRLADSMSLKTKARLKAAMSVWSGAAQRNQSSERYIPPEELALQLCDTKLPLSKAERILGYDPIPFEEGTWRAGEWLRLNGFAADIGQQVTLQAPSPGARLTDQDTAPLRSQPSRSHLPANRGALD